MLQIFIIADKKGGSYGAITVWHLINMYMSERPICPCCNLKPVAIINHRHGKTYYRKKCDQCYRKHRKPMPAGWIRSGYKKKDSCFRCRRKLNYPESSIVWYIDGNADNCDWLNLRTVCLVCAIDLQHGAKLPNTTISADF